MNRKFAIAKYNSDSTLKLKEYRSPIRPHTIKSMHRKNISRTRFKKNEVFDDKKPYGSLQSNQHDMCQVIHLKKSLNFELSHNDLRNIRDLRFEICDSIYSQKLNKSVQLNNKISSLENKV